MTIWRGTEGNVGSREIRTDVQVRRTTHVHDTDDLVYAPERPQWQTRAACRSVGPARFFPEQGDNRSGKDVCRGCEVRTECLHYAIRNNDQWGVWGGLTLRERRAYVRSLTPAELAAVMGHTTDEEVAA